MGKVFLVKSVSEDGEVFLSHKLRTSDISFDPDGNCDILSFTCWCVIYKYHQISWDAPPPSWEMKLHSGTILVTGTLGAASQQARLADDPTPS